MDNTIKNMVGLEAEFFVTNLNGGLVYPNDYGFSTDEYIILGEFRANPGETRHDAVANFLNEWYKVKELAKSKEVLINISEGYKLITPTFKSEILKKMGTKAISESLNINNIDLLTLSDDVIEKGVMKGSKISTGLHIHFTSGITDKFTYKINNILYTPVELPISIGKDISTKITLYKKQTQTEEKEKEVSREISTSRITKPVLKYFVEKMDKELLPKFKLEEKLKFRNPGFYEMKFHGGFEYRSLPFNQKVLDNIYDIVDFSFSLLEEL